MTHEYDADTAVQQVSPGTYRADVTDRWGALGPPVNGGYLLGIAVRAMQQSAGRPDPLVVSAFFLRPGQIGPAEVHTEVVRSGRRFTTSGAAVEQDGKQTLRVLANFGDLTEHEGLDRVDNQPPALPPVVECQDLTGGRSMPGLSIVDRLDYRMPVVPGWVTGQPSGELTAEFWLRFADRREPDTLSLPSLVDGAWPVVMEMGARGSSTVELTVHVRARPAPGWLACRVNTRHVMNGMHEEDFEVWDSTGTLVAQSRQLALLG